MASLTKKADDRSVKFATVEFIIYRVFRYFYNNYCASKKSCPVFIVYTLYTNGQDFSDIDYNAIVYTYIAMVGPNRSLNILSILV